MIEVKVEVLPECALLMKEHLENYQYIAPLFVDESELKHAMEQPDAPAEPVEKLTFENMMGSLFSAPNRDSQIGAINYLLNYTSSYNITLSGRKKRASSGAIDAPIGISHVQDGSDREPYRRDSDAVRDQQVLNFIEQVQLIVEHVYPDIFDREKPSKNLKNLQIPSRTFNLPHAYRADVVPLHCEPKPVATYDRRRS